MLLKRPRRTETAFIAITGSSYIASTLLERIVELIIPTVPSIRANNATSRKDTISRGAILRFFI
jgi:hypothetical protein